MNEKKRLSVVNNMLPTGFEKGNGKIALGAGKGHIVGNGQQTRIDDSSYEHPIISEKIPVNILQEFHPMICNKYAYDEIRSKRYERTLCGCGREKHAHEEFSEDDFSAATDGQKQLYESPTVRWNSDTHAVRLINESCYFGAIKFKGFGFNTDHHTPYICVGEEDSCAKVWELMNRWWKVPLPKLVVSIVGGAKRSQFAQSKTSDLFKRGLVEVATSTGAWIVTPGTRTGVYGLIGDALADHLSTEENVDRQGIVLLGITAWGSINNRDVLRTQLDRDAQLKGLFPAVYDSRNLKYNKITLSSLEPNHTHFIMVDDGTHDRYDGEIKWRVKFEKFLSSYTRLYNRQDSTHVNIENEPTQLVTILINGGDGSIENIADILRDNPHPIVVIAGSGRAADCIIRSTALVQSTGIDVKEEQLIDVYQQTMGREPYGEKVLMDLKLICKNNKYVTAFDFERVRGSTVTGGLQYTILKALQVMQDEDKHEGDLEIKKVHMNLALAWNKVDFFQKELFDINNPDYQKLMMDTSYIHQILIVAMVLDLNEFVSTLLDYGVDLEKFVNEDTLRNLYNTMADQGDTYSRFTTSLIAPRLSSNKCCYPNANQIENMNQSSENGHRIQLLAIGDVIQSLIGGSYPNELAGAQFHEDPAKHLFYWAVLYNRFNLARIFWRYTKDQIGGAIVGASLYRGLARKSKKHEGTEITAAYEKRAMDFELLAYGLLEKCWDKNRQLTSSMLVREQANWGRSTLMSMADRAEMEEFLAQPACHNKLRKLWCGNIDLRVPTIYSVLFAFIPFLFVFLLKFTRRSNDEDRLDEVRHEQKNHRNSGYAERLTSYRVGCTNTETTISYFNALYQAWTAPIVRFIYYLMYYLIFLTVYSLFVMTELREFSPINSTNIISPNTTRGTTRSAVYYYIGPVGIFEFMTWIFVFVNLFEEIRQIMHQSDRRLIGKLESWFHDEWNKLDLISFFIFSLAITLRCTLVGDDFYHARWVYCLGLACFYLRFFQMFYVVEQLGPKIIMIRKMLVDVIFFLFILIIVLFLFGVVYQALLSPESEISLNLIIYNVIALPYWQMYGELGLEQVVQAPSSTVATFIVLVVYMILTNVLLLNLLIAMFSHTFEKVQANANILWKFHYYRLVFENSTRPYFPPIGTLFKMCSIYYDRCLDRSTTPFKIQLSDEDNRKITSLINVALDQYLKQEIKRMQEDVANQVSSTAQRLDSVIEQLDDLRDDVVYNKPGVGDHTLPPHVDHNTIMVRISKLESKLDRVVDQMVKK